MPYERIRAVIDLDALIYNIQSMKQNLRPGTQVMAVVKADGYGHGAVPVAEAAEPYVDGFERRRRKKRCSCGGRASASRYWCWDRCLKARGKPC